MGSDQKSLLKICIFTGTRAEYGLLFWLMKEIKQDPSLELQIIVSGSHLSSVFGNTYQQIEDDGFNIDCKVDMLLSNDSSVAITKSMGLGLIGMADALNRLKLNIIVLLGDRNESLTHIAPGVNISGGCTIADLVHIGTGAILIQSISVGQKSIIGAGSVIISDIPSKAKVAGVPGKAI